MSNRHCLLSLVVEEFYKKQEEKLYLNEYDGIPMSFKLFATIGVQLLDVSLVAKKRLLEDKVYWKIENILSSDKIRFTAVHSSKTKTSTRSMERTNSQDSLLSNGSEVTNQTEYFEFKENDFQLGSLITSFPFLTNHGTRTSACLILKILALWFSKFYPLNLFMRTISNIGNSIDQPLLVLNRLRGLCASLSLSLNLFTHLFYLT